MAHAMNILAERPVEGLSPQSCLYFQDFES